MVSAAPRIWAHLLFASIFTWVGLAQGQLCPNECECLFDAQVRFQVDCSGKNLTEIPEGIDRETQILDLSDNFLTFIPPEKITSLIYLEKLCLRGNQIQALSPDSLLNLTSLIVLDLSGNLISEWQDIHPNVILQPATSLQKLILSKNPFRAVSHLRLEEILVSETVQELDLSDCGFTSISGKSPIAGLKNLRQLRLSHNPLKRIQRLTSPTLRYLDLSHCELTFISYDELNFLPSLTHLRLSHNIRLIISDETLPFRGLSSSSLMYLDVSYCNMNHISLGGFPALQAANLRGNMIRKLNANDFINNTHLQKLDLSSNSIEHVDKNAFDGLVSLKYLNLSINVIPALHDHTFLRLKSLSELHVSRNYLSSVGFLKSTSITYLDMSYCEIQHINKVSLQGLTHLEEINLSKNLISSIPDFLLSKTLKVLDLRYNRLSRINNDTFAFLPSLTVLRLSENRFSDIWKVHFFQENPNLQELSIHDNTWRCECHNPEMRNFFDFITKEPPKVWNINDLQCDSPINVSGKNWLEACFFIWHPEGFTANQRAMTYILIIFVIFFMVSFAIMLIRRAQHRRTELIREQRDRELQEERDRLREQRMRREQEQQRNAPDPRDLVSPPTYDEALLMPRLDGSFHSLAGVGITQEKKQRKKMRRRTRSSGDLLEMDPDSSDAKRQNRRRRRQSTEVVTVDEETTTLTRVNGTGENNRSANDSRNDGVTGIVIHHLHESDF